MELKYKLLAVVSTLALSTWAYNDFIDNDAIEKALKDQIDLLTVKEQTDSNNKSGIIVAIPEATSGQHTNLTKTRKTTDFKKNDFERSGLETSGHESDNDQAVLVPQGPTYFKATAPLQRPHTPLTTPQINKRITQEAAVKAAIDGSENSLRILQKYFDASAGQQEKITDLASGVLQALGNSGLVENSHNLQEAAARVIDAAARAATSAYTIPYSSISDFGLSFGDLGWDLVLSTRSLTGALFASRQRAALSKVRLFWHWKPLRRMISLKTASLMSVNSAFRK